ncbi:Outer membrane porin F precursor [Labrenzia sp. THAF82]|uniref:OmpA family protein n=1 Tax=Labrenzia sp. THAF82 TaxID=2587861 RepID=UPI0012688046|nr:OmpA family protein [Labrenzia sp. THAF82]QFT30173.1 Outer membrane porin F precursor [Labrenzia sp. THAF82]
MKSGNTRSLNPYIAKIAIALTSFSLLSVGAQAQQISVVALENGAVLKSYTSEFGGRNSGSWIALALIDGDPTIGWSSAQHQSAPNEFVFELAEDYVLEALSFDNTHTDEPTHPGISAQGVKVFVSDDRADGPYREIYQGNIAPTGITTVGLEKKETARFVKLLLSTNGGHAEYTELMEFAAFGQPQGNRQQTSNFSGVYTTNWGPFYLKFSDGELSGCYDHDNGKFVGTSVGGVMNIEWREDGEDSGSAVLALSASGDQFSGLWYKNAELHGTWIGKRSVDQAGAPQCAAIVQTSTKSKVAQSLDAYGVTRLYGIYFDFDSDVIKPESATTLNQVQAWLKDNPGKRVVFEGHTDAKGSDAYNQSLSAKRAAAVVRWLSGQGVDIGNLTHVGLGEIQPVADNATETGRSLNRRVEMKILN